MSEDEKVHEEIIIVRRGHDDHDDHHGGAWKVAFADFMTAMMAFFLVMWLINASSEETKKAVASYFNPIKLTDRISNPKGLRTPKYGDVSDDEVQNKEKSTVISNSRVITIKGEGVAQTFDEQALFADPYALLAEISSGLDTKTANTNSKEHNDSRSSNMGLTGGEAYKDPFDPSSWNMNYDLKDSENELSKLADQLDDQLVDQTEPKEQQNVAVQENAKTIELENAEGALAEKPVANELAKSELDKSEGIENAKLIEREENKSIKTAEQSLDETEVAGIGKPEEAVLKKSDQGKLEKLDENKEEEPESDLVQIMRKKIQEIVSEEGKNAPDVQIKGDASGTVITLFDKSQSGMFSIGSARPSPEMVRIMKKIGEILSREKGKIVVGGHTDGRKYKSKSYDNWRLSTARAHMAYYMLVRGGVSESRFEMISGFGAVKLAVPDDPFSPINRRIEISLRVS